jgi:penicillin-binding protein 1A
LDFQPQQNPKTQLQSLKQANSVLDGMQASRRMVFRLLKFVTYIACSVLLYLTVCVLIELHKVPNLSFLEHFQPIANIQVFDCKDRLICNIEGVEKRKVIPLSKITKYMQHAVLTAEDHHFYEHHGVDYLGVARAMLVNIMARHAVQGGSTITQQLAKNLFFEDSRRNLPTKVAEWVTANNLENRFPKDKILELYLNEVYFGNGAYGIEQAANRYFNKSAALLTIAESAYIAGLIRWPSRGGDPKYMMENVARQQGLIDKMHEYGYISEDQSRMAKNQTLIFESKPEKVTVAKVPRYPYYVNYCLELIHNQFTQGEIERHGMKVYTNLDPAAQEAAERALGSGIRHAPAGVTTGALVSENVRDGAVVAMVGGVGDYMKNQWNCATNPHTTGSAFKPFVYLAAFNHGLLKPGSYISDAPLVIPQEHEADWKPKNYDGKYMGDISVSEALAYSRNTCAVRAAMRVGIDSVIETARLAGIKEKIAPQLSASLGCSAASPLEMATAYATLARGGVYHKPQILRRVEDKNGITLCSYYSGDERVFETQPVSDIVDILQEVVAQGTGTQARLGDRPVAGKTGTADQAKDLWFVGFTPDLVTAVWGGNDDNKPIPGSHITGGTVMARIWRDYNRSYYRQHDVPTSWFVACSRIAGNVRFPSRESKSEKDLNKVETGYGSKHVAPKVVRYEDIDPPSYRVTYQRAAHPAAVARSGRGVTEYRWSH